MAAELFLGLLLGCALQLTKLYETWRDERIRKNNIASNYFHELSETLMKVVTALAEKRIPTIDGNRLNTLLHNFESKTAGATAVDISPSLKAQLAGAAVTAKTLDAYLLNNLPTKDAERVELLATIERIAGACSALAALLKEDA